MPVFNIPDMESQVPLGAREVGGGVFSSPRVQEILGILQRIEIFSHLILNEGTETAMIRPIVKYPAPGLEKICTPVSDFNSDLEELAGDMFETLYSAPGIGLAAPQVGVNVRLIVVDVTAGQEDGYQLVFVNPEVIEHLGRQKEEEGCLSVPGLTAKVERPTWVRVKAQDLEGNEFEIEGEELLARVLSHEIDHLEGIVYLDRLSPLRRDLLRRKIKKLIRAGEW